MARIPDSYLDLLNQKKAFASLATVMTGDTSLVRLPRREHPREHRQRSSQISDLETGRAGRARNHGP